MMLWMAMAMATIVIIAYIPKKTSVFFVACQLFAYFAPLPTLATKARGLPHACHRSPRFAHQGRPAVANLSDDSRDLSLPTICIQIPYYMTYTPVAPTMSLAT